MTASVVVPVVRGDLSRALVADTKSSPTQARVLPHGDAGWTGYGIGMLRQSSRLSHHEGEGRGRFRFLREIGRGSMGVVRLAEDVARHRRVAVKAVAATSPLALLRLKREFRLVAPIQHPGLVRLHELWSDEAGAFYTMDFIQGRDLRPLLREELPRLSGPQRVRFAMEVGAQALPALACLHDRGVVHRDIKPSNIMLTPEGVVKLVDFGLAAPVGAERAVDQLAHRGSGTPPYVAPEQACGGPPTPASDLHALGVLLFEMTAGRFAPASRDGVPAALSALCAALRDEDPRRRPDARTALSMLVGEARAAAAIPRIPRSRSHAPADPALDRAMAWLGDHLARVADGAFVGAVVEGPPGAGKSRLLRWVNACVQGVGGLVFAGGATPFEHATYNVIDAAVDAVAGTLLGSSLDVELARDLALASEAFPVLGGGREGSRAAAEATAPLDALVRLVASLAGGEGVYLLVDDLDVADAASLAFLDRLWALRPGGVGVVAAFRGDRRPTRAHAWLAAKPDLPRLVLGKPASARSARLDRHADDFVAAAAVS